MKRNPTPENRGVRLKAKVIVATLFVAATASADARFAWQYPRKTLSPGESGQWIVISGNSSPQCAGSGYDWPKTVAK